jgi:molybdopterin-guanine dinucleotide biosynthesis protein A
MNRNFSGYVLAGGKSSRMRSDKAFLEFDGETFLERAVSTLETACESRVKIVLNRSQTHFIERLPPDVSYIFDIFENRGALGGIHAALLDCRTDFAIILACDMPFVTGEAVQKLAGIALARQEFAAIVPVQPDGKRQPLCAVYSAMMCLPAIEKLLKDEVSASMKDFLSIVCVKFIEQRELTRDAAQDLFFNVNRPDDFRRLG